ncbi:MAG: putative transport system permease protein [Gammaproteobacteria bacterium]|jgi:putative ABC transport system permease protein|nr:transporter permease [Gammaproteobacteria bacterium]MEA3141030.1 putative transport system permease protein [Gammaproteobacteria bacterium]
MLKQLLAVILMSLQTLPQRIGASSVIVIGIAGVVAVLISVLAMGVGFRHTLADSGRADRVIIIRGGSDTELSSNLTRSDVDIVTNAPGLAKGSRGEPLLSNEIVTVVNVPKVDTGTDANVTLRGVGLKLTEVRPELKIISGGMFRPAVRELIAGAGAAKQFRGLVVGNVLHLRNADWTVTGVFTSNGDVHESELLADVDTVGSSIERPGYSSVVALLSSPADFDTFKAALTTDPQLKVSVQREADYYAAQSKQLTQTINIVGNTVAIIMAIGAMFGALNTMYSAVAARGLEIATLRAIGFGASPVLVSVMIEALLLSLFGGIIGASLAWLFFNGHSVSTLGGAFAQVVFKLRVTQSLIVTGIIWACIIGLLGGFFPALRAARLPVAEALRAA